MPLYFSPRIGPFSYVKKVDGKGTASFCYLMLIGWWWVPTKLLVLGLVWLTGALYRRVRRAW